MTKPDDISRTEIQVHVRIADLLGKERPQSTTLSLSASFVHLGDARLVRATATDLEGGGGTLPRYVTDVIADGNVAKVLAARDERSSRPLLSRRALREVLETGKLPYPDTLGDSPSRMNSRELRVSVGPVSANLVLHLPLTPITGRGRLMSWVPRCEVDGDVFLDGKEHAAHGIATTFQTRGDEGDRIVIHLEDGTNIHAWRDDAWTAIVVGNEISSADVTITPLSTWISRYTFHEFDSSWRVTIPMAQIDLELRPSIADQELVTVTTSEPLWLGRAEVTGTIAGRPIRGVAYVEQTARATTEDEFFAAIPREAGRVIEQLLPLPLEPQHVRPLLGDDVNRYVTDIDVQEFQRILIEPIREIIDRKGKAWRSYTAVVCYHAVNGDRQRSDIIDVLLGLAEVIHVGSLIVDDVEDASSTRRGGPACHIAHGVPIAINAGTFCYFVWQAWLSRLELPDAVRLEIYEIYFEFMRVAHLGQALDIQGFTRAMADEIVATGDVTLVERQMKNVYMLKTGAPASVFARIGALVAGAEKQQVRALADLFEALGIAFQIMDDVNNLKGFHGDPKHCEDLAQAKVTMPVLEAMRVLDLAARRDLWDRIGRCGNDAALVPTIIETLDKAGAFTACRDQANRILEDAWRAAEPHLFNSFAKVMLRSFCLHIVESLG